DKPEGRGLALLAYTPSALGGRLTVTANGGAVVRGRTEYANIVQKSAIAWGGGAAVHVLDPLWLSVEVFGESTPAGTRSMSSGSAVLSPVEWLAGLTVRAERRFTIGLAGGRGVTDALGTPDVRGMLTLAFVPGSAAVAPVHAPEPIRPDGDADGDGIPDSVDKCPNEPEDFDMFEDQDGCPDPDNDHDGIPDAVDKCPLDPEDKDGFQDEDGCPDKDNDGDGIPDDKDRCPNQPEDKDGFEDLDGCPDLDNDHDGIPDAIDKCPNQPETINGFQDDDGCPDKGDTTIILSPDRIETLDPIMFNGGKLTKPSLPLIEQVGATLRAHAEIVRLRITVHVQPSGDSDADQGRSDKRAQAVRDWLVNWGIAASRLEVRGFGGRKPLVPPGQRGAGKINDRIELIILERK
ncbi:MAG TPA: OmpA family protein, partial [Kofleriaceae bacterium]